MLKALLRWFDKDWDRNERRPNASLLMRMVWSLPILAGLAVLEIFGAERGRNASVAVILVAGLCSIGLVVLAFIRFMMR